MPIFGQAVIGPPGAGKSTYCRVMRRVLEALGRRPVVINLDPAAEAVALPERPDLSITELLTSTPAATTSSLGPNGALITCAEMLERNVAWLDGVVRARPGCYFLFDCPGQTELVTHHASLTHVFAHLQQVHDMRLCIVNLIDAVCCVSLPTFVSALTLTLMTMLQLSLPHVNALSKIDLVRSYGQLPMPLEFYTEAQGLHHIAEALTASGGNFGERYIALTDAICGVVEDFGLVCFTTLSITDRERVLELLRAIDKANGFAFAAGSDNIDAEYEALFGLAASEILPEPDPDAAVRESYFDDTN